MWPANKGGNSAINCVTDTNNEYGKIKNCREATARQSCQDLPANAQAQQAMRRAKNNKRFVRKLPGEAESLEAEALIFTASACISQLYSLAAAAGTFNSNGLASARRRASTSGFLSA